MDDKKIQELITLSGMHDHQAQKELGIYYASLPKTNRNIANAERYLKLAAEKHDNSATYELIKFYRDYVKYMISESKGVTKVNYYFKLAMKWCDIARKQNAQIDKIDELQKETVAIYNKGSTKNKKLSLNYKVDRKFKIVLYLCFSLTIATFVVYIFLHAFRMPESLWAGFLSAAILLLALTATVYYLHKSYKRTHDASKYLLKINQKNEDKAKTVVSEKKSENSTLLHKLSQRTKVKLDNTKRLTSIELGIMGEAYIYFQLKKYVKYLLNNLEKEIKKKFPDDEIIEIKWVNRINESTDPFDFKILTKNKKSIFFDVKTSAYRNNPVHISEFEKDFFNKINKEESLYLICRVTNFNYTNVGEFEKSGKQTPYVKFFDVAEIDAQNVPTPAAKK